MAIDRDAPGSDWALFLLAGLRLVAYKGRGNQINSSISNQSYSLLTDVLRLLASNHWPHSFVALAETCFVSGGGCAGFFTFACRLANTKHADVLLAFERFKRLVNHFADVINACVFFGFMVFGWVVICWALLTISRSLKARS